MISVEGLKVEFGVKPLFSDATFVINEKDRIALVGKNGAGKSTMLKILCGMEHPTAGTVSVASDATIGYLPQVLILQDDTTVRQEAQKAFSDIQKMADRIKRMEQQLSERTDYESADYMALVEKFSTEHERYQMLGAEGYEAEIERTLVGLGFQRTDFERPTSEFSGGWRMRIELAKILLRRPDVLLLDEPTNHLDMPSKDVLKEAIKAFDGTAIIVSHDREFLDGLVSKVYEFGGGKVREYLGGIYDWINKSPHQLTQTNVERSGSEKKAANNKVADSKVSSAADNTNGSLSYAERKELLKKKSRLEKSIKEVEKKIESLEARIAELDAILCTPEGASDMTVVTEYTSTKRIIDQETDRWAQLSEELDAIEL